MCYVSYYYRTPCFYRSRCGLRIFFQLNFNNLNVEFFVKKIKAQADFQFVKIFGD